MLCAGFNFKGKPELNNIISTITSYMEQQADVLAAYLFGSMARGRGDRTVT
ncbi:nucleotidyltransferase domain-containing protein [Desulfofundulus thermocisternus]|uniref:nucleotidyltransferase domain-containing protein n=1 Tax=Desulfofundulus thermocisternus TaxID=42471 RepID=UPI00217D5257|nr:nucleotidyltransferase domain-containing protein [Desulfofundulus thermocisternus]MCS5696260.1 nucleotidyltransferase domain-containing protein [Desulfofundulus thermocisternus]